MKKFISVILATLMVVAVMPFAIFAADDAGYTRPANTAHACHPKDESGNLILDAVDLKAAVEAGYVTVAFENGNAEYNKVEYLYDGSNATATRLPVGTTAKLVVTAEEAVDFATLKVVVNGKGTINGGSTNQDKVIVDTTYNLKLNVVVYAKVNGQDVAVYTSDKDIDTSAVTEVSFDVFEAGYKVVITTVGAAEAAKGGPRLWEISATTVKGEEDYVHDYERVITKAPSLYVDEENDGTGLATDTCKNCGKVVKDIVIPAMTAADLNGGTLGLDDVTIEEYLQDVDSQGNILKDDDGNEILISKPIQASTSALFDGNKSSGGLWNANGSYWTAGVGGKLTIKFNEPKLISYLNITLTLNGWPGIIFSFYNGDTLVGIDGGNWKQPGDADYNGPADRWTTTCENRTFDFAAADMANLQGKVIDKIVIEITNHNTHNYRKISEIEVGCHVHVFDEADVKKGTQGTGEDICKWTHTSACVECHEKVTNAVTYLHDTKVNVVREATCGDGKAYDTCKTAGCNYNSGEYVIKGTGEHDFSTEVLQSKYATCGADGVASFVCSTCMTKETASMEALVGKKLAKDLKVGPITVAKSGTVITEDVLDDYVTVAEMFAADYIFYISAVDAQSGAAVTVKYSFTGDMNGETANVGAAANGYHNVGYKSVIASTYTTHGVDGAYCTTCGTEFKENTKVADLLVPNAKVRLIGFSLRTAEFEGVRATFSLNKEVIQIMKDNGYNVRIYIVVTNEAGESREIQVYGAGAKAWLDIDGRFSVVVKGGDADETYTFSYKVVVNDKAGVAENVVELGSASVADIKAQ